MSKLCNIGGAIITFELLHFLMHREFISIFETSNFMQYSELQIYRGRL